MSAPAATSQTDRSDFRTAATSGAKLGALTAAAVVVYTLASGALQPGLVERLLQSAIVLATGTLVTFLPGWWVGARRTEGVAGAAAVGLAGTVAFTIIDVVVLRPLHLYPWTWDAIGGGSGWWYLPVWWMYGTFLAWLGGIVVAGKAAQRSTGLGAAASPVVGMGVVLGGVAYLLGCPMPLPFLAGSGFTLGLVLSAVLALNQQP